MKPIARVTVRGKAVPLAKQEPVRVVVPAETRRQIKAQQAKRTA